QPSPPISTLVAAKPAPWAEEKKSNGPSLREIQETEAKQADLRKKQALAESRAISSPSPAVSETNGPSSMTWGLASQPPSGTGNKTPTTGLSSPALPVWGSDSGTLAPKKTLKQIQEEEEKRKAKAAAAVKQVAASNGAVKRGYADLAANAPSVPAAAGWSTVGAGGKATATTSATAPASIPSKPSTIPAKPVLAAPAKPLIPASIAAKADDNNPSIDFIRWTKQALTGLTVNVDDFIAMLLTFPVDPPASSRADQLEIISDSVYANSSTLDGRRFAQEFYTKRKADAAARISNPRANKVTSLADVVKTQPKPSNNDIGFKIVKAKGKGKKQ
ncbi:PERQ amino acid-rich with GYF domain-containing protein, partial [Tremellales sp. Uapishka_1]